MSIGRPVCPNGQSVRHNPTSRHMYPTKDDFRELLRTRDLDWIIDEHLFQGTPFYSADEPDVHDAMVRAISIGLKVPRDDICVVGSARVGFSLSPPKFGEPFGQFSDIDIIVVSSVLFDPSWLDILGLRRKHSAVLHRNTRQRLQEHRERHYIYNGWIYPSSILETLEIGERWLETFNGLSRIPEFAGRPVEARLYRTWDHARLYHRWSFTRLQTAIFT